ncbi:MAG: hypothetical protein V1886_04170 [archaeon]
MLESGVAWIKFKEIIKAQKGNVNKKLDFAEFHYDIKSEINGKITEINNKKINSVARVAGCPGDKKAGIYLLRHCNNLVKKGDIILTIYSESIQKLKSARELYSKINPVIVK